MPKEDPVIVKCIGRRNLELYGEGENLVIGINLGDSPGKRIATLVLEHKEATKLYLTLLELTRENA